MLNHFLFLLATQSIIVSTRSNLIIEITVVQYHTERGKSKIFYCLKGHGGHKNKIKAYKINRYVIHLDA